MTYERPAQIGPIMSRLATYMAEAADAAMPEAVVEKTKLHVLDTFAAMVSGAALSVGAAATRFATARLAREDATVVGTAFKTSVEHAALANGMLAHADETDDSHAASISHPGCAVIPAALALGELNRISGTDFLAAVALGYDVGPRVTMTLGVKSFFVDGHKSTHSVAGLFGAAAAAGAVLRFNADRMRWLMSYAAQQSSGVACWRRDPDHIQKAYVFGGMPASNATLAALMVAQGFTGVDDPFSGEANFFMAYSPEANTDVLIEGLGDRFEIMNSNIKKWSVGSPIQAPLDGIEALLAKGLCRQEIEKIFVHVADREAVVVDNRDMPDVCLQHLIAVILLDGVLTFEMSHDRRRMADPQVQRERSKIVLVHSSELARDLPRRRAIVEVILRDGRHLTEHVDDVRGTTGNPMIRDEVVHKARDLMDPVIGSTQSRALVTSILALEQVSDVASIARLTASAT